MPLITQPEGYVLVVHGNLPMLQPETIRMLTDAAQGVAASRLVYCEEDEETRPCAAFCFEINHLRRFLERDLPHDVEAKHFIRALRMEGERVVDIYAPAVECAAVYDRESLWDCTYPVSYTHLQAAFVEAVQRRNGQVAGAQVCLADGIFLSSVPRRLGGGILYSKRITEGIGVDAISYEELYIPVSYTHLDVYKRQPLYQRAGQG